MRSFRRVTQRVAPALASVASVLLFATCDFDKISGTPKPLSPADIARVFTISTDSLVTLGGTLPLNIVPATGIDLGGTTERWESSNATVARVDTLTGVVTGMALGTATITGRVLAPELDTGIAQSRSVRVRYKGIQVAAIDSIAGKNLSRAITVRGTNATDLPQNPAISAPTLSVHDSGATTTNVATITGSSVFGRSNGAAYVVALFDNLRDSVKVKVRQVAKSLVLPVTYTATALNMNRPRISMTLRDVNDSVMTTSPVMRFRSSDTTVFTIDSLTGIHRVKTLGTATMFVRVDTVQKQTTLVVDQGPGIVSKFAGDAQTDTIGRLLPTPLTVTVLDSGNTVIQGDTVTFRVSSGSGIISDSVKITDANGRATLGSWRLGLGVGAQAVTATSGAISAVFNATARAMRPYAVDFNSNPKTAGVGATMQPVVVFIKDSLNNHVTTATDSVTLAIQNNPGGATLGGTIKRAAVAGVATFNNLTMSASGVGYTLAATSGTLQNTVSDAFDVFGGANKIAFVRQPVGTSAGANLDTIQIAVQDAQGVTVASDTRNVSIGIGTNPGGGAISGTTTVAAVGGVATFTGISINAAGAGYTLNAGAGALGGATSNPFTISAVGAPAKLAFTTQPGSTTAGATPTLEVTIQDANGARVTTSTAAVTIALGSNTAGGTLSGTLTRNAVSGVATFPGISINRVGTGYTFTAASASLLGATSSSFNITAGTATKLGFIQNPTHSPTGTAIAPSVTVAVQDAAGNTVSSGAAVPIAIGLTTGCTGATLAGGGPFNTSGGVATFTGIIITGTASNCTLTASSTATPTLTPAASSTFNIVAASGAVRVGFATQPQNVVAGNGAGTFQVQLRDNTGSLVSSATNTLITLSVLSGPGTIFSGATATTSGGVASFNPVIRVAGQYKLLATATGYKVDSSNVFTISAGTAQQAAWIQPPTSTTAGVAMSPAPRGAAVDQFGNIVTTFGGPLQISLQSTTGGASITGTALTQTAVNGEVTFTGMTIKKAFAGYTIFVNSPGNFGGAVSAAFDVTPGPMTKLGFSTHPDSPLSAGSNFSVTVQAQDSVGNANTSFNGNISIAVTGGDGSATLGGTTTGPTTSGSATFSNLTITKSASDYKISASASGLSTGLSNSFAIVPTAATKLGWIKQPTNTFPGAPIRLGGDQMQVAVQDQYGNTQPNGATTVRIGLVAPGGIGLKDGNFATATYDLFAPSGVATIPNTLTLTGSNTGIRLSASTPFTGLTSANSDLFDISPFDTKAKLGFSQQPTNGTYASALTPTVTVAVQDQYGNTVANATDAVTLALSVNPSGATLASGTATAAVAGIASFPLLNLDKDGSGYQLDATAPSLTTATSSAFNIQSPGIAATSVSMNDMTRIGNTIYWIESGTGVSMKSMNVQGGPVTTIAATNGAINNGYRIANDGTNVYWIEGGLGVGTGVVKRLNVAAGTVTTLANGLTNVRTEPSTFTVSDGAVYFLANNGTNNSAAIRSVGAAVSGPTTPADNFTVSPANINLVPYFTVSGGNIYFQDPSVGNIKRLPTSGGASTQISTASQFPARLTLSGTTLVYSENNNIKTLANASSTGTPVAPATPVSGLAHVFNVVVDGTNLYTNESGNLKRYNMTTFASVTTLSSAISANYQTPLINATDVFYFTNTARIQKQAK